MPLPVDLDDLRTMDAELASRQRELGNALRSVKMRRKQVQKRLRASGVTRSLSGPARVASRRVDERRERWEAALPGCDWDEWMRVVDEQDSCCGVCGKARPLWTDVVDGVIFGGVCRAHFSWVAKARRGEWKPNAAVAAYLGVVREEDLPTGPEWVEARKMVLVAEGMSTNDAHQQTLSEMFDHEDEWRPVPAEEREPVDPSEWGYGG